MISAVPSHMPFVGEDPALPRSEFITQLQQRQRSKPQQTGETPLLRLGALAQGLRVRLWDVEMPHQWLLRSSNLHEYTV